MGSTLLKSCTDKPQEQRKSSDKSLVEFRPQSSYLEPSQSDVSTEPKYFSTSVTASEFAIVRVLGIGGFGKVYLVEHLSTERKYAMKVLKKEVLRQTKQIVHTINERQILSKNASPFLVRLHYAFQTPDRLFMVMDFAAGGELFMHIREHNYLTEERTRFYAAELLVALDWLHSRGAIYRDLKPENVLLDAEGHIKLSDFGLSKLGIKMDQAAFSICGTPEYMAPEVLRGEGHNKAADYWSLGALLYVMLGGSPPFTYSSRENRREILNTLNTTQATMLPWFSAAARDLILKLLTVAVTST
jgi:serine/threonine protein kinase